MTLKGCDSSFSVPTLAQARAAYSDGCRVWGGYLGSAGGLGLAVRWSRDQFAVVQQAGMRAIGFCSGWDNPDWIRDTAAAWGLWACVDVEHGIRDDGPWVRDWVRRAACGLYGLGTVHYEPGEPIGRDAAFNIVARYPSAGCSGASWDPAAGPRPPKLCGWQCQGSHAEYGVTVDAGYYDDGFLTGAAVAPVPAHISSPGGEGSMVTVTGANGRIHRLIVSEGTPDPLGHTGGPVRWVALDGGPGGLDSWGGGDGTLPGGGGWIAAGTLSATIWLWPERQRELLVVQGRGPDGRIWRKALYTDDFSVEAEWKAISGPSPAVPGTVPIPGPAGPAGELTTDDHIAEVAVAEIKKRLES